MNKYNQERNSLKSKGGEMENKKHFNRHGRKKHYNDSQKSEIKKTGFAKSPAGFLVVSLFITGGLNANNVVESINSVLKSEHKKKIVISFDSNVEKPFILNIKRKFENAFGVFFLNPKIKLTSNSVVNSSLIHYEVFKSFKSQFFLMLEASIIIREFSLEKMISFLCKDTETLAIAPKFYTTEGNIIYNCKRFFTFNDFFGSNEEKKKEHFMLERGDVGYYSIHRVDYSSLECILFLSDALSKIGKFSTSFKEKDVRDASLCNKFYKKAGGKIIFYPHSRVIKTTKNEDEKLSTMSKIKYILKNKLSFKNV